MCMMSVVMTDGFHRFWDHPIPQPYTPPQTWTYPIPPVPATVSKETLDAFMKLVEAAKEYDTKTEQRDCEDPLKMDVLKRIEERLAAIEKQLEITP